MFCLYIYLFVICFVYFSVKNHSLTVYQNSYTFFLENIGKVQPLPPPKKLKNQNQMLHTVS